MNAPLVKNPRFGFQSCVLILALAKLGRVVGRHRLPRVDPDVGGVESPVEPDHVEPPVSSEAAQGKNWSLRAGRPDAAVDRNLLSDQCRPPSGTSGRRCRPAELGRLMLFW